MLNLLWLFQIAANSEMNCPDPDKTNRLYCIKNNLGNLFDFSSIKGANSPEVMGDEILTEFEFPPNILSSAFCVQDSTNVRAKFKNLETLVMKVLFDSRCKIKIKKKHLRVPINISGGDAKAKGSPITVVRKEIYKDFRPADGNSI